MFSAREESALTMIPLSRPDIQESDIDSVASVMRSHLVSIGPAVSEFETAMAASVGVAHAVSMNSGTSALHAIVRALGLTEGDCVLTTSFSFIASSNCLLYERVLPLFCDVDPESRNLDPQKLEAMIEEEFVEREGRRYHRELGLALRGVLVVDTFGIPADYDRIEALTQKYGLFLIEDSCEALGSRYYSRRRGKWISCGAFGDAGCFGFYANKQITTGEGGVVVTADERVAARSRVYRNHGRESLDALKFSPAHTELGYNYRMSAIQCALGRSQLSRLPEIVSRRKSVYLEYMNRLESLQEHFALPRAPSHTEVSWFVFVISLRDPFRREETMRRLHERGVQCSRYFAAIHTQPYYQASLVSRYQSPLPVTESLSEGSIALPFYTTLSSEDVERVCKAVDEAVALR